MGVLQTALGAILSPLLIDHALWAAKLASGKLVSEHDTVSDLRHGSKRALDWSLDLVATGDVLKIKELWLICPPNVVSPLGNTARLPIVEPGTAFQFKVASLHALGRWERQVEALVIGRVDNKETGDCTCFIWDTDLSAMSTPYHTNIYAFAPWRDGIAPLGKLSHEVLGLRLGTISSYSPHNP